MRSITINEQVLVGGGVSYSPSPEQLEQDIARANADWAYIRWMNRLRLSPDPIVETIPVYWSGD
jgi:hypothetical protein